jgi:hypothetical protein
VQDGLVAEEVAQVYPEAVSYDAAGEPDAVQYHRINAMLITEVQRQQREIAERKASLAELKGLIQK